MRCFGAELFAEAAVELATAARDESIGQHELRGSRRALHQCVPRGDGSCHRSSSGLGASTCSIELRLRFSRISDCNYEISAAYTFVARTCVAHRTQSVAILLGHNAMLHCR
jgi:hypothetical protein